MNILSERTVSTPQFPSCGDIKYPRIKSLELAGSVMRGMSKEPSQINNEQQTRTKNLVEATVAHLLNRKIYNTKQYEQSEFDEAYGKKVVSKAKEILRKHKIDCKLINGTLNHEIITTDFEEECMIELLSLTNKDVADLIPRKNIDEEYIISKITTKMIETKHSFLIIKMDGQRAIVDVSKPVVREGITSREKSIEIYKPAVYFITEEQYKAFKRGIPVEVEVEHKNIVGAFRWTGEEYPTKRIYSIDEDYS